MGCFKSTAALIANGGVLACITVLTVSGCTTVRVDETDLDASPPVTRLVSAVTIRLQMSGVDASLRGVSAVSESVCWVSGADGTVLRTTDGGDTWQRVSMPTADGEEPIDFRDIEAFDEHTAVAMGVGSPALFYKTNDGGGGWREVYRNEVPGAFFDAMDFWDGRRGLAFSDPVDGHLLIVRTKDGGDTWQEVDRTSIPPALGNEAGFAGSGTCLFTQPGGHAWIGLGGDTGRDVSRVFVSRDYGQTWRVYTTPIATSASAGIFSIAFFDARNGLAVGGDYLEPDRRHGNAAITVDGGHTWLPIRPDAGSPPFGYRSAAAIIPATGSALAVGPNGMDISDDGGRTWSVLSGRGFHALSFALPASIEGDPSRAIGWAVGAEGRIARLECSLD